MVNRVTLTGHLGADPEIKTMPSGDIVANVRLASTERYKDRASGSARETTERHRLVFFGRLAEVARDYLVRGSRIYVDGRLRTRKWVTADGQDRYTTEIVVEHLEMLGGARGEPGETAGSSAGQRDAADDEWTRAYENAEAAEHSRHASA
jgi:single-strand DNA-binding protein